MKSAIDIVSDMFSKKLADGSHEKWTWLRYFKGKHDGIPIIEVIEKYLAAGKKVKGGYTCTQIRGYHDRWILVNEFSQSK